MRYPCRSKHCGFASDNQRGLTNHQRACDAYKRHERASLLKRNQEKATQTKVGKLFLDKKFKTDSILADSDDSCPCTNRGGTST
jgi:hypothetical protein